MIQVLPKILHVDDNPNVLSFVGPELRSAGFNYVSARTGNAALAKMESERPDLVVLDVMLGDPTLGGLDVCRKIREVGHMVPVIFLTVKDRTDESRTMSQAFSLGATDYITKREELKRVEQSMGLIPTGSVRTQCPTLFYVVKITYQHRHTENEATGMYDRVRD